MRLYLLIMRIILALLSIIYLSSCASNDGQITAKKPEPGLFSKDVTKGISLEGFLNRDEDEQKFYVNSFLWRASLDVASFAPFQSTDAFGGIIITEWYKKNDSKIKLSIFIKSRELRSEGIKVKVYVKSSNNEVTEDRDLSIKIENLILTKARELRISNKIN